MDEQTRLARARTFDAIAELYDSARPRYREELFDDLFALSGLAPRSARVLEVGCGTGQATQSLALRGCQIVGVELGPNLAHLARRNLARFPDVTIVNAAFEDWENAGAPFAMLFAATSWHWIDPRSRYAKAANLLKPDGVLAFTTGAHAFPPGFDSFFTEIQASYDAIGEAWSGAWPPPPPDEVRDAQREIEESGLFGDVRVARYVWADEFDADAYVALMSTASDHRLMALDKRERLFSDMRRLIDARPNGRITRHWLTILHVARRKE
jgi:SAM-dependent methyltransferase